MKKHYFLLFLLTCYSAVLLAEPYGLLVNGTTQLEATSLSEKDFQDRDQFLVSCVQLNQGDKIQLYDFANGASWMSDIDPYGEYEKFSGGKSQGYLTCNAAGSYDFYIKLKYEDDLLYIGPGENCTGTGTTPTPTPDPNTTYYITGSAELVGSDKAWSATAIAMTFNEGTKTYTHTFNNLAAGIEYSMKITNGTWDANWGYSAVQNKESGVIGDNDGNVVFELASKGNVVVHFNTASITMTGNFVQKDPVKPKPSTSVPSACPDVMLQGFYWDSNQDKYYGNTRWSTLQAQASEIASYFDLIWLPPSSKSTGGVGYLPQQYSNQNSDWGSQEELTKLIKTFHDGGAKVIADMVVNHIASRSSWCDFYVQDFGKYGSFAVDGSYICKDDEMNSDPGAGSCNGKATGAYDDGYNGEANYGAARDLAHNEEHVRKMCRAYAQWMIDVMDYDGFRYDYCKGFHSSHVDDYNANAGAYFSVIEYWDGNADVLWDRIRDAKENTLVFDFGMKYNVLNEGIAQFNYGKCKGPNCLIGRGKGKWAVNFIDNHDTFERGNGSDFGGNSMSSDMKDRLLQANAFILSMPGVPCIFYPHWKTHSSALKAMILARKAVGVHSESSVSDEAAGDGSGYRAYVTGTNGTLILELGSWVSDSQWGYTNMIKGPGYAMWVKPNKAVAPELTITPNSTTYRKPSMTITMSAVGGIEGAPKIYYTLDGTDPRNSSTRKTYSSAITITGTKTLKAYAESGNGKSDVQTRVYTYIPPQEDPITISFQKPANWSKAYLYTWTANGEYPTGIWPGQQMTQTNAEGIYYQTLSNTNAREINFIFNNGVGIQSQDLLTYEDVCYGWENNYAVIINCSSTDVENVVINPTPVLDTNQPMYNILGQPVNATYKGIVIQNGYKYLLF